MFVNDTFSRYTEMRYNTSYQYILFVHIYSYSTILVAFKNILFYFHVTSFLVASNLFSFIFLKFFKETRNVILFIFLMLQMLEAEYDCACPGPPPQFQLPPPPLPPLLQDSACSDASVSSLYSCDILPVGLSLM